MRMGWLRTALEALFPRRVYFSSGGASALAAVFHVAVECGHKPVYLFTYKRLIEKRREGKRYRETYMMRVIVSR